MDENLKIIIYKIIRIVITNPRLDFQDVKKLLGFIKLFLFIH